MATSTFVCSLILAVGLSRGPMPIPIQDPCQSRKTAENFGSGCRLGLFANQDLVGFPILLPSLSRGGGPRAKRVVEGPLGNIRQPRRVETRQASGGVRVMIGKLLGAWVGEKIAGRNEVAKGAIFGYGAVA